MIKKSERSAARPRLAKSLNKSLGGAIDRRGFLKGTGLAAGGAALAGALPLGAADIRG